MVLADWIFIGGILGCLTLGALIGFGKGLKFITRGIIGFAISMFVCYTFGGIILDIPFVTDLLTGLSSKWAHIEWLYKIHLEIIIYYIILFAVVSLVRVLIVKILAHVLETDVFAIKVINKACGAVLFTAIGLLVLLFVFQIIAWRGGDVSSNFLAQIAGSTIVKPIYENNPMAILVEMVKF